MHSEPPQDLVKPGDDLQFDRAELEPVDGTSVGALNAADAGRGMQCALSGEEIQGVYYEVNGRVLSENSYRRVEAAHDQGTGIGRFLRAAMFGVGAGALGALIYYFFLAVVGLKWAVISIAVGYLVGHGVRLGSRNRGGLPYQLLAVMVTYLSIAAAYVPLVVEELQQVEGLGTAGAVTETAAEQPAGLFAYDEYIDEEQDEAIAGSFGGSAEEAPTPEAPVVPGDGEFDPALQDVSAGVEAVLFVLAVVVFSFLAPFFGGILSILIIGFGLYQAWQLNRKQAFGVAGPFQVGRAQVTSEA